MTDMQQKHSSVPEIVGRSLFYTLTNYLLISMELSFRAQWLSVLFSAALVWCNIGVLERHLQTDRQKACRMGLVGRLHCCKHRHCVFCGVYPRDACSAYNIINTLLRCIFEEIAEAVTKVLFFYEF